jgi:UDP-N-acetylmuramate: L-alanyl-gamma-D-glutamyl-meso-diaminopimelate ligase
MTMKIDKSIKKIHLVAACGTGMGTLACILKEMGYEVSGSDQNVYPPMSDFLIENGINLFQGYNISNLDHNPDLVIIGNAITKDNVEAKSVLQRGIKYLSMPQAVNMFIAKDKKIILVTGTHGKTTTSSIMAHILHVAGMDPSFMIGGILKDFNSSFRIGNGEYMVIEGDEYDTAFFDKGPKFMHYDPDITIITGIEFDHADIFTGIDHIKHVFADFIKKTAKASHIIAFDDNDNLNQVIADIDDSSPLSIEKYGRDAQWSFNAHKQKGSNTLFTVRIPGKPYPFETRMTGEHNLYNCLACIAAACKIGISYKVIFKALKTFSGIKRRQEVRGIKNKITIMDDFAHHPTAVRETINGIKPFYKNGKVIAVFEPRTNTSMRKFFQESYPDSFLGADMVCVCKPGVKKKIAKKDKFSTKQLVKDIEKKGVKAYHFENSHEIISFLVPQLKPGDLVLIMSNGGFDNIHTNLLESIE